MPVPSICLGLVSEHVLSESGAPNGTVRVKLPTWNDGAGEPFETPAFPVLGAFAPPVGGDAGPAFLALPPVGSQVVVGLTTPEGSPTISGVVLGCVFTAAQALPLPVEGADLTTGAFAFTLPDGTVIGVDPASGVVVKSPKAVAVEAPVVTIKAAESVRVESPEVTVVADHVYLGAARGEPLVLGRKLLAYLRAVETWMSTHVHAPPGGTSVAPPFTGTTAGLLSEKVEAAP